MNDDYVPIPCIEHERLEFAVLRRQKLALKVRDENGDLRAMVVLPTDVATRDQAEWLTYRDAAGTVGVLRLDRIQSADVIGGEIP
jgi:Rho-binding antiterminator